MNGGWGVEVSKTLFYRFINSLENGSYSWITFGSAVKE